MRKDIKAGANFPDYELPDHSGKKHKISALQGTDPAALILARGGYCPKEHRQHMWMAQMEPEITVSYCRFITISTDNYLETIEWKQRLGAHWTFLSDQERLIQKDLEIKEYTDPEHDPMIPYTILLEPGLKIYKIYNGYWYTGRPTPEEMRQDLRQISQKYRPDWDITKNEIREKWKSGDKDFFWPYGKGMF